MALSSRFVLTSVAATLACALVTAQKDFDFDRDFGDESMADFGNGEGTFSSLTPDGLAVTTARILSQSDVKGNFASLNPDRLAVATASAETKTAPTVSQSDVEDTRVQDLVSLTHDEVTTAPTESAPYLSQSDELMKERPPGGAKIPSFSFDSAPDYEYGTKVQDSNASKEVPKSAFYVKQKPAYVEPTKAVYVAPQVAPKPKIIIEKKLIYVRGPAGPPGPAGPTGAPGQKGDPGVNGSDGADGKRGSNGTNGNDGSKSAKGDGGQQGDPGPPGKDGADDADSKDGKFYRKSRRERNRAGFNQYRQKKCSRCSRKYGSKGCMTGKVCVHGACLDIKKAGEKCSVCCACRNGRCKKGKGGKRTCVSLNRDKRSGKRGSDSEGKGQVRTRQNFDKFRQKKCGRCSRKHGKTGCKKGKGCFKWACLSVKEIGDKCTLCSACLGGSCKKSKAGNRFCVSRYSKK